MPEPTGDWEADVASNIAQQNSMSCRCNKRKWLSRQEMRREQGGRGARMTSAVGPEQAKLEAKALGACDQRMSSAIIALQNKLTTSAP